MKYAGLIENDFSAAPGVSVTFFTQGCPHRCKGCHNSNTWDFNGGKEFTPEVLSDIINALKKNNVKRNFCIMGGEPLCDENLLLTCILIENVKKKSPETEIYVWSGYTYEELLESHNPKMKIIFDNINYLIDGPYIQELRDVTLEMRGSSNQRIVRIK